MEQHARSTPQGLHAQHGDEIVDLREYAALLWRRRRTVVATVAIVVLTALAVTFLQTPIYEAEAELAIEPVRRSEDASLEELILGSTTVETERRVITSGPVATRVIDSLGLDTDVADLLEDVTVSLVRDTRVVQIRASSPDAAEARDIANAFADEYLDFRRDEALSQLLAAQTALDERADSMQDEINDLNDQIDRTFDEEERTTLTAQRDSLLTQLGQLVAQRLDAQAATDLVRGGGTILQVADTPDSPASPKRLRTGILALVLGGMLGVGMAFLRDWLDDGIHSEDAAARAGAAPVMGRIPTYEDDHDNGRVLAVTAPQDHAVEAYRQLRTNVRFLVAAPSRPDPTAPARRMSTRSRAARLGRGRSVLVTSATAGEGKSSTAANLAVVAAQAGTEVVLIDGDLRRPRIADLFGLGQSAGLSDLLAAGAGEDVDREAWLVDVGIPNLKVLPSGAPPPNPAELLSSDAMYDLLLSFEDRFGLVIVDSPPVLAVADALELAPLCSAVMLVMSVASSSQRSVRQATQRLHGVGGGPAGVVLNQMARSGSGSYYDYYRPYEPTYPKREANTGPSGTESGPPTSTADDDGPNGREVASPPEVAPVAASTEASPAETLERSSARPSPWLEDDDLAEVPRRRRSGGGGAVSVYGDVPATDVEPVERSDGAALRDRQREVLSQSADARRADLDMRRSRTGLFDERAKAAANADEGERDAAPDSDESSTSA